MGVKFGREYADIIEDFYSAIRSIDRINEFFEMSEEDWQQLEAEDQNECVKTLADDIFYGLGTEPMIHVGGGVVVYDRDHHIIKVFNGEKIVHVVNLV
jgi:predicted fused transcriptional regulator/phosphomethylpyrimidine kinase